MLANTNSYNVWIHQPLLAADIVEVESCPWDYQTILSRDGKNIKASFCQVPPPEVQEDVFTHNVMSSENPDAVRDKGTSGEKPKFGPRPDFSSLNFDFEGIRQTSFPIKSGES